MFVVLRILFEIWIIDWDDIIQVHTCISFFFKLSLREKKLKAHGEFINVFSAKIKKIWDLRVIFLRAVFGHYLVVKQTVFFPESPWNSVWQNDLLFFLKTHFDIFWESSKMKKYRVRKISSKLLKNIQNPYFFEFIKGNNFKMISMKIKRYRPAPWAIQL